MGKRKKIPEFKSDAEERAFWEENESSDYIYWSNAEHAFLPNLKPSTKTLHQGSR